MAKALGYIVMERSDACEQGLAIFLGDALPTAGILSWREKSDMVCVFPDRDSAREAIKRTEHYRLAFGRSDLPESKFCIIVPVAAPAKDGA